MLVKTFKPMLSGKAPDDLATLKFPLYASPKLDGIRCLITSEGAMTRNLKAIPNKHIRECFPADAFHGLDGELIVGKMTGNDVWNRTQSGVMREDGEPKFMFHVFDCFSAEGNFRWRQNVIHRAMQKMPTFVAQLEQIEVRDIDQLMVLEERYVSQGFEGIMLRDPIGPYKYGRSTTKEGYLMKLKRFEDHEAQVVGMVERFHNANEAKKDELGRTKRSSHKANKMGTGMLGALVCIMAPFGDDEWDRDGVTFEIGTGFTEAQRKEIWRQYDEEGLRAKFKCQGFTPDGVPRFPVFLGFRDARDA